MPPSPRDAPADRRLECPSTFESLEEVVEAAERYAREVFSEEEAAHEFVLAVSEAVANAIEHGNASDPAKQVVVDFCTSGTQVEARVEDEGGGFDPGAVENPTDVPHLTRTHGRGLYIIHEVADAVHYEADGRRVRMCFERAST